MKYTENSSLANIIGLFAVVVSVWVSLSIYNIVEKKDIQKTKEDFQKISAQINSLRQNYSTFNIDSLKYIRASEDRINGFYTNEIWNILKNHKYPEYEIATNLVRIENLLISIIERFSKDAFYQMKEFLDHFNSEIKFLKEQIKLFCKNNNVDEEDRNTLNSYLACRTAEYNYYLYFRDKHFSKSTAFSHLQDACENYEKANSLCPEANKASCGYIDNALAYLYLEAFLREADSESKRIYIEKALAYSSKAVCYDSHYAKNYRNHGVILETHARYMHTDLKLALEKAKKQYEKALECSNDDYKNLIAFVSSVLKINDLENQIDNRSGNSISISSAFRAQNHSAPDEIYKGYHYLILAALKNTNDVQSHYHMIHILMYMYLHFQKDASNAPLDDAEIIEKAKAEIRICETILKTDAVQKGNVLAFLFKARNFFDAIKDNKEAKKYNDRILQINSQAGDAQKLEAFYTQKP